MHAVVCREYGPIDRLKYENIAPPPMVPGSVRIAVEAAGIAFAHLLMVAGKHQNKPPLPFVPGTDIAGTVIELAPDVEHLTIGDRVVAAIPSGGWGQEAIAPAGNAFRMPDSLSFPAALQFPGGYATVYATLAWRAALKPGEVLLVHGAGGGHGLLAVEVGKALGATVIATAGSPEKLATVKRRGADHAINYREQDFRAAVQALTDGRGADVIFDPVGGDVFDLSLRAIAPEGRIIPYGFASGRIPQIPANIVLVKNLTVVGIYWGYYMGWGKTAANPETRRKVRGLIDDLFSLCTAGKLAPEISETFPLAQYATALGLIERREAIGKIALIPPR